MKVWRVLGGLLLAAVVASGCSFGARQGGQHGQAANRTTTQAVVSAFPLTVTDDSTVQVTFQHEPKRIVTLVPSATDIVLALGLHGEVVGADKYSLNQFQKDLGADVKNLGGMEVSPETVLSLKPDLVVTVAGKQADALRKAGLPVIVTQPQSLAQIYADIKLLGTVTGQGARAAAIVAGMKQREQAIRKKVASIPSDQRVTVYYEVWYGKDIYTVGPGSFIQDLIETAGGKNIFANATGPWPMVSAEAIIKANPQVILAPTGDQAVADLKAGKRVGWNKIDAVVKGRIVTIPDSLVSQPDTHAIEALEQVARALYPNLFR